MQQLELVAGMKRLGIVYGKEYSKDECELYYDFLSSFSVDVWVNAVNKFISTSKFPPKPADLLELCEQFQENSKFEILEYMQKTGYFKHISEYEKATMWLTRNIIPEWFKTDLNKYYKLMKVKQLEQKETLMIS